MQAPQPGWITSTPARSKSVEVAAARARTPRPPREPNWMKKSHAVGATRRPASSGLAAAPARRSRGRRSLPAVQRAAVGDVDRAPRRARRPARRWSGSDGMPRSGSPGVGDHRPDASRGRSCGRRRRSPRPGRARRPCARSALDVDARAAAPRSSASVSSSASQMPRLAPSTRSPCWRASRARPSRASRGPARRTPSRGRASSARFA